MSTDVIDIEVTEGYVVVRAIADGIVTGRFLLDTGADVTAVSPAVARQLDLPTIRHHESGVAGGRRLRIPLSRLGSLSIAGYDLPLDPVAVVDLGGLAGPYGAIDGIIGSDYLREVPVTIDYRGRTLTFESSSSLEERAAAGRTVTLDLRDGTTPFVKARLNGSLERDYKLDTGAGITHVPLHDLTALGFELEDARLTAGEAEGPGGAYPIVRADLDSFSLGPGLEVAPLPVRSYAAGYGFVGANYLRHFVLTLSYRDRRIVLARP